MRKETKKKENNQLNKKKIFSYGKKLLTLTIVIMTNMMITAMATNNNPLTDTAVDEKWNFFTDFLCLWGRRLGGAIAIFGAAEWVLSHFVDNSQMRTMGPKFIIGGLATLAIFSAGSFFFA